MMKFARYGLATLLFGCMLSSAAIADGPRRHKQPVPDSGSAIAYLTLSLAAVAGTVIAKSRRSAKQSA